MDQSETATTEVPPILSRQYGIPLQLRTPVAIGIRYLAHSFFSTAFCPSYMGRRDIAVSFHTAIAYYGTSRRFDFASGRSAFKHRDIDVLVAASLWTITRSCLE
jgi:hypothetical protein